jgi:hypothetical protein
VTAEGFGGGCDDEGDLYEGSEAESDGAEAPTAIFGLSNISSFLASEPPPSAFFASLSSTILLVLSLLSLPNCCSTASRVKGRCSAWLA